MTSNALMVVVTGLYAAQAGVYFWKGLWPLGVVMSGYAFANVGFIVSAVQMESR
jgi:hypothetical protein